MADLPTERLSAFTAYAEPDPEGAVFSVENGGTDWKPAQKIVWYGRLDRAGKLDIVLGARLGEGRKARLRLTASPIGGRERQIREADMVGRRAESVEAVSFGTVGIPRAGYWRFALERLGGDMPSLDALYLTGLPMAGAQFNLKERRNAASVHLSYPTAKDAPIAAFYNEVTVREDPLWSYTMACGWHRGYFGIQVNSRTERRIIFSVWDSGNEAIDRSRVADDDRVQLLEKGAGVIAESFGNEGTGGHSHLVYPWKRNTPYRFCVTALPDGAHTTYTGWFWFPERRAWGLIARFRAPKDGGFLRGLYSFSENFGGANGQLLRRAEFGNGWIRRSDNTWSELREARFTCDATGKAGDRLDFAAGVLPNGRFFLQHGGFVDNGVKYGDTFTRPPTGRSPAVQGIEMPR